jgi:hypothetical protein
MSVSAEKLVKRARYIAINKTTGERIPFVFQEHGERPKIITFPDITSISLRCVVGMIDRTDPDNQSRIEHFDVDSYFFEK